MNFWTKYLSAMKKTMQLWTLAGFLAGLFCLGNIQMTNAQNSTKDDSVDREIMKEVLAIRKNADDEIIRFKKDLEGSINLTLKIIGLAVVAVGILVGIFGYKSLQDIKGQIEKKAELKAEELFATKFNTIFLDKFELLQQQLILLKRYQASRILFIGTQEKIVEWKEMEINLLQKIGLKNIAASEDINRTFLDIDVLVYQYRPNTDGTDIILASLVQRLRERQVPLPLIVYVAAGQRMDADGEKLLQKYRWFIYANMPLTLLGHIYNAANVFHASNSQSPDA